MFSYFFLWPKLIFPGQNWFFDFSGPKLIFPGQKGAMAEWPLKYATEAITRSSGRRHVSDSKVDNISWVLESGGQELQLHTKKFVIDLLNESSAKFCHYSCKIEKKVKLEWSITKFPDRRELSVKTGNTENSKMNKIPSDHGPIWPPSYNWKNLNFSKFSRSNEWIFSSHHDRHHESSWVIMSRSSSRNKLVRRAVDCARRPSCCTDGRRRQPRRICGKSDDSETGADKTKVMIRAIFKNRPTDFFKNFIE